MFKHLTDFKFTRSTKQAFGFYFVYLFGTVFLAAFISYIYLTMTGKAFSPDDEDFAMGAAQVGSKVVVFVVLALSMLILKAKNLLKDTKAIITVVVALGFTFVGGGLLGFIPVAYLTTLEPLKKVKES